MEDEDFIKKIDNEMADLNIDDLDIDESNERDKNILEFQEINENLIYKLIDLEEIAKSAVLRAYSVAKGRVETHRHWDTQDETLIAKDAELKEYQAKIEAK